MLLAFPELLQERNAAEQVKQAKPILVILGNPPYNGFAGLAVAEERDLSDAYRTAKRAPQPQGQGLNDLYVRFYRMAERRIVEKTGKGIVCFISNYSWLDGRSFTAMRELYLERFDRIWIDCLNGDKYKTGKLTPEGQPDPSIFSTEFNKEGIQVGTAIALLVRRDKSHGTGTVEFGNLWGREKRAQLLEEAEKGIDRHYTELSPPVELGFPFQPGKVASSYLSWPLLPELFPVSFPGVKTSRDELLIDIDRERLIERMKQYFDPDIADAEMEAISRSAMASTNRFDAKKTRRYLVRRGFNENSLVPYSYRPFDDRWLYWEPEKKLLDEKREDYFPQVFEGNIWIEARQRQPMERFDRGYVVSSLADNFGNGLSNFFPLYLKRNALPKTLFDHMNADLVTIPNVGKLLGEYLKSLGVEPTDFFSHCIAVLHSESYRRQNAGALRLDWPRIPLPAARQNLLASAKLGREVGDLLQAGVEVKAVTTGKLRSELVPLATISREGGGSLDPDAGDLSVTAGWAHRGVGGAVMPSKGSLVHRDYSPKETETITKGMRERGLSEEKAFKLLGERTFDVYLNDHAYWKNIPSRVWEYTIGGYQVIKKWLSYREREILGRDLTADDVHAFTAIVRRIASILLLEPKLDANYHSITESTYPWPRSDRSSQNTAPRNGRGLRAPS